MKILTRKKQKKIEQQLIKIYIASCKNFIYYNDPKVSIQSFDVTQGSLFDIFFELFDNVEMSRLLNQCNTLYNIMIHEYDKSRKDNE